MDIDDKKPEDVLKPEFVQQYKELHKKIWHRLVETNTTIAILEKIQSFPFHRFYSPNENIFWTSVYWNFLDILTINIHTIVKKTCKKDEHTLPKFVGNVHEWLQDSEKVEYSQNLKEVKFDQTTENIRKKITDIRDKTIAHRLFDEQNHLIEPDGVKVSEIRSLYDATEELFRACSFGAEYVTTLYIEGTCGGKPIEKDIDHILDLIVKDSYWLNEPERNQQFWQICKTTKSSEEILELNQWRKKFGMPEV
ncbi:MAG: hypothetical protein ABSE89_08610 [Sedimentisphaerales bacterium]